jgi:transposase
MKPYSLDLREKLVRAYDEHFGSQRRLASLFGVSRSFVERLLQLRRSTGTIRPRPHAGGRKPNCDEAAVEVVRQGLREQADATREELRDRLRQQRGVWVSVSTLSRLLTRLGLPRKKSRSMPPNVTRRGSKRRASSRQWITALDPRRLTFVDESGVNLAMTRLYGRAPPGERVIGSVPQNYGQHVTLLGAVGVQGIQAVMTVEGPMDSDVFRAYIKHVLGPTLTAGDMVVMDNLAAHKTPGIQQMLARRRVRLLYWPPYSPDLSPIEPCWSKVKTALRRAKARTREALDTAITAALRTITAMDVLGWFQHCGYALH